jgi:type I restriction-modification system DNA methylase subunit
MLINAVIDHIRNRSYMSGVDRDKVRVKSTGEVFTPTALVNEILDSLPTELFTDSTKTFIDPSCGDGQFLGEVLIRKMENGNSFEEALSTIYGVDLMIDNVDLCRERLLCGQEHLRHIVEQNIQCRDSLKFGYNFKPMGTARRNTEKKARVKQKKLKEKQEKLAKIEKVKKKKEIQQKKLFGETIPEFV